MSDLTKALIDECMIQSENCSYTAATFTFYLSWLRKIRLFAQAGPLVFGALATWKIVAEGSPIWAAVFALLTTVIPPAYKASKKDAEIEDFKDLAGEFTNLRDRFRQAATIHSLKPFTEFEAEVKPLMKRLEDARRRALTPPQWCFWLARRKHKAGHYEPDYGRDE